VLRGQILEFGRGRQRSTPAPSVSREADPIQLDIEGRDEDEPPPRPGQVRVTRGAVVGVALGLLAGAAAWNALDDWRTQIAAQGTTNVMAVLSQASPSQEVDALSSTFTIFNLGEHPITVEGIALPGWDPQDPDQVLAHEIAPGKRGLVNTDLAVDCSGRQPRTATRAIVDVRTVDGRQHAVEVPLAQWRNLSASHDRICAPNRRPPSVRVEFSQPELEDDGTLTLAMRILSEHEDITVTAMESLNRGLTVDTAGLPATVPRGGVQAVETVWRVIDCATAQTFDLAGVTVQLTLDDGTTRDVDASFGPVLSSLVRLTERTC